MANCEKSNTNGNNTGNFCGSHLSNADLAANTPIFSWASSQAMCNYSMNSNQAIQKQMAESHNYFQAMNSMLDMSRGMCEDNTQHSLHTSKEALTCTEWEHPHSSDGEKSRIVKEKDALDPHADGVLQQLEEYVNELVPALHMVNKSTHNMDIAHRQEAIKLTADALLGRRATGMAWSDALRKRVLNYCSKAHDHQGQESLDLAESAMAYPEYMAPMECASSSCIRTPVSSEDTNSCEFSDPDFSAFHHESPASLASSDHSSMVDSTSELLQDDMDALNYVQSGVSLPLVDILNSSDAHMSSVNTSGELLSICKQGENQLKSECELHEEMNARLLMIRGCCKEWNEDAGTAKLSSNSALESLQAASSTREEEHVCTKDLQQSCNASNISSYIISPNEHVLHCNVSPAHVNNYHLMRTLDPDYWVSHAAGEGTKSFHLVHPRGPCWRADMARPVRTCCNLAAASQLPCADVQNRNVCHKVACSNADVACNVIPIVHDLASERAHVARCSSAAVASGNVKQYEMALGNADLDGCDMTGLQPMQTHDKGAVDDLADEVAVDGSSDEDAETEAKVEAEVEGGRQRGKTWQRSNVTQYRTTKRDVPDEVADEGQVVAEVEGDLRLQQGLTWPSSMYFTREDGGAIRRGSHGDDSKMREMMYRVAAYQPIDWESIMKEAMGKEKPRRRNVRISKEPQSVAARRRRERVSERIRILQRLVPGTSKLDTASMLDEAIHYLKFLKLQVQALRRIDKFFTSLPLSLATSDCPSHLALPYPQPIPTPSHLHPFPLQI